MKEVAKAPSEKIERWSEALCLEDRIPDWAMNEHNALTDRCEAAEREREHNARLALEAQHDAQAARAERDEARATKDMHKERQERLELQVVTLRADNEKLRAEVERLRERCDDAERERDEALDLLSTSRDEG